MVSFKISVPSTSANIGPGFDVLGLSMSLYLELEVSLPANADSSSSPLEASKRAQCSYAQVELTYSGEGATEAPLDPYKNLITRVALYVLRCHDYTSFPYTTTGSENRAGEACISIHVTNSVPFGRGLGSSGAAVIAGVLLADRLGRLGLSDSRRLDFALMVERHPDNVAAALLGGFVASYLRELPPEDLKAASIPLAEVLPEYPPEADENWGRDPPVPPVGIGHWVKLAWSPKVKAIAVIPAFEVSTAKARAALQPAYALKDCVFNLQRLAVLTQALGQQNPDPDLIFQAMQDRLHQPYRKHLIPALPTVLSSFSPTSHPGLLGICLSGAGPTILALATQNFEQIAQSVCEIFQAEGGIHCRWLVLDATTQGGTIEEHL
ncbi:uncharacterized protein L969DRAFT_409060 [Mixia osmundae IAM 14324]|uniref:Homoserine kinase n=1 Tax=Mixia osmundae (strain CBS 9802 / IAM 14324 / JCM 22182 / KY 12970) TaxID=764103 RepID=G7E8T3_MIXOS|nr:uncharacterized protein L969DRAFT_409060 [Mixia osmundae IAM 14324]KEI40187.1 hypothetical protein L969DRAFT_409060 [Mixia osmundae IAM 14324]GAA99551.1 hypothetical protein E5Q_06252 [Mixia osmundae IAM 14324]